MPADRPESIEKIVARFQKAPDDKQRYKQLLWFAGKLDPLPEEYKTPENKVPGCISQVFIIADFVEGKVFYRADSDALTPKGLVALLIKGLNGLTPAEIVALNPDFIQDTQLNFVSVTPGRANGFYNIFKTMQHKAQAFLDKDTPGAMLR